MPTARELLEQADALMRRNRADAMAKHARAPAAHAPAPEPESPREARRDALVNPADLRPYVSSVEGEMPASTGAQAVEGELGDDVPVLTEAVDDIVAADGGLPQDAIEKGQRDDVPVLTEVQDAVEEGQGDDVPVLTEVQDVVLERQADDVPVLTDIRDVVEEKQADDVPAPVRGQDVVLGAPVGDVRVAADARAVAAVDRGEEVRTLDAARDHFDVEQGGDAREASGGQEAPGGGGVDDDVPLLTDAVEEIEAAPAVEAEDWGEPSLFGEIDRDLQGAPEPPPYSAAVAADLPVLVAGSPAEPSPVASAAQGDSGDPVWVVAERLVEDSGLGPRHRASAAEVSVASEVALVESSAALDEIDAPLGPYRDSEQEAEEPPATAGEAAPVPAGGEPRDDAYWASLAEDVRMQVLQRIDIFTDTGLRQQLGERLKPVVDRASADLVSTVSQHVGELLRAYVAEAIEREIERWRSEGR